MSGKDWLNLGLGALAGLVGSTAGKDGRPAPIKLASGGIVQNETPRQMKRDTAVPGSTAGDVGSAVSGANPNRSFSNSAHAGGIMADSNGGSAAPTNGGSDSGMDQEIFAEAVKALMGQSQNPRLAIQAFVAKYGKEALQELAQHIQAMTGGQGQQSQQGASMPQQMPSQQQPQGYAYGGPVAMANGGLTPEQNVMVDASAADQYASLPWYKQLEMLPSAGASNLSFLKNQRNAHDLMQRAAEADMAARKHKQNTSLDPYAALQLASFMSTPQGYANGGGIMSGPGDGTSDHVPALLSPGEYVLDASTVADLGNGSTEAGARKLDSARMALRIKKHGRSTQPPTVRDHENPLLNALR